MTSINVVKTFTLNLGAVLKKFEAGVHEVEDDIAQHWYVLLHIAPPAAPVPEPAPVEGVTVEDDGTTHVDTPEEVSEKHTLIAHAETLGIAVDGRWGVTRLQAEIAKAGAA
ncbi:STY1053 family phage-associated protein [Roseixanthobacter glucoisosaccharinicivorans]|uniref:STY1053 family phage-associated protein n=1 Tax=Roseixanthobacter glucoisosaccharinicivorans TaxID=3119923 RepID=UPI003727462B